MCSIMQDATEGPLQIDGATLEGGGQVIRSSLSLAFLQPSRPLRLHSIIERWLATKSMSPMTGGELEHMGLSPHHMLRRMIREWRAAHPAR